MTIIGTAFEEAFCLLMPDGKIRRFGSCDWHDEDSYSVDWEDGKFWLVHEDSRDNGYMELGRQELPPNTMATSGYHRDERGEWKSLSDLRNVASVSF